MTQVLALIPARGGSKGIPRKNIRLFAGRPLIAWSIAAARKAEAVTRVIVSTDDMEIANLARRYGAEAPFLRPTELALDHTTDLPVFIHALKWLEANEGYRPEILVQLRPTSPIRPKDCVDRAVRLMLDDLSVDSVRGVVQAGQTPYKMWRMNNDGRLIQLLAVPGLDEPYNAPRQSLPSVYWQTGHIDAIRPSVIQGGSMSGKRIVGMIIDARYTVDIDLPAEWTAAERIAESGLDMVRPD